MILFDRCMLMANRYQGDLSIQLTQGDLSITIPNNQLVLPDRSINNDTGNIGTGNSSEVDMLMVKLAGDNAGDNSRLGRPFLANAYLMVDYDAGTFTLWNAKASRQQELVAICNGTTSVTSMPPASSASSQPLSQHESLPSGQIAGIFIGSIAGVTIVGAFAALMIKRWKAQTTSVFKTGYKSYSGADTANCTVDYKEVLIPAQPQEIEGRRLFQAQGVKSNDGEIAELRKVNTYEMSTEQRAHELSTGQV